ncbi:MAG TPA: DUF2218 domain-containing protein [Devosia sp.]|nr:DUF2218 domain-containing protein [Devosia sp.]
MTVLARHATPKASQYLQQLCKHFGHKVPATFTETHGEVQMPLGLCVLDAADDLLTITITPNEPEGETRLVKVIAVHLERFAWKEGGLTLSWERDGVPDTALMAALAALPDPHKKGEDDHHEE